MSEDDEDVDIEKLIRPLGDPGINPQVHHTTY